MMKLPGPWGTQAPLFSGGTPGFLGLNDPADFVLFTPPAAPVLPLTCACDRDLTVDELCRVFVSADRDTCTTFAPLINAMCTKYEITTCLRKAHLLAQVGGETGDLKWMSELDKSGHAGYYGRGLLQITDESNYKAYGTYVSHDFTGKHRSELEEPSWATDSAGWYWRKFHTDLNPLADKNDLITITARINGGFNGYTDRLTHLKRAQGALLVPTCKKANVGTEVFLPYAQCDAYDNRVYSFAWGYWNDDKYPKRKGIDPKQAADKKEGYARYLVLQAEDDRQTLDRLTREQARRASRAVHGRHAAATSAASAASQPASPPIVLPDESVYGLTRTERIKIATEGTR